MGILSGLAAVAAWFVLWPIVWTLLGLPVVLGALVWVIGLAVAFAAGVRLGDPRLRGDPVSRIEERQRARRRFEARTQRRETESRLARLAREDREADARAEAHVRALVERGATVRRPTIEDPRAAGAGRDETPRHADERG